MPSPAERYAAARERSRLERSELGAFSSQYVFGLDRYQVLACQALEAGKGVLVAAPTGSGKTVVGEFAIHLALATGQDESEVLRLLGGLERSSQHPLAAAIVQAAESRGLTLPEAESFASVTGKGATGVVEGHAVVAGNAALLADWSPVALLADR